MGTNPCVRNGRRRRARGTSRALPIHLQAVLITLLSAAVCLGAAGGRGKGMKIIGHRGVPSERPQNTLAGLRRAIEYGLDYVEVDLRTTSDGKIVDMHDDMVDRTTDGKGAVASMTCAEIKRLDAGSWFGPQFRGERVPLFAEELALGKGRMKFYLDMKNVDPLHVVRLLEQFDMVGDAVCLTGVDALAKMKAANPNIMVMPRLARAEDMPTLAERIQAKYVERGGGPIDIAGLEAAHRYGAQYFLDIQGEGDNEKHILDCLTAGVDAVQTDHPALVIDVLRRAGVNRNKPGSLPEVPPAPGARLDSRKVKIIAHRGVAERAPQNTLAATRETIAMGLDYIEVDVQTTADGLLLDMHNHTVDRTTNGHGAVRSLRYAQIRALDAGSWFSPKFKGEHVPLLGEVLALAKGRIGVYIDWKDADPEPVVRLLQEFDMTRDVLVHAGEDVCRKVRALDPSVVLMPGASDVDGVRRAHETVRAEAVEVASRTFTPEAVRVAHELGMLCATSLAGGRGDTPEFMKQVVAAGVDLIETDQPEMLLEVLQQANP